MSMKIALFENVSLVELNLLYFIVFEASKVNASQQEIKFPRPWPSPDVKPIDGVEFSLPLENNSGNDCPFLHPTRVHFI